MGTGYLSSLTEPEKNQIIKINMLFFNELWMKRSTDKNKKVYPLICIQRSMTFEFNCYVSSNVFL